MGNSILFHGTPLPYEAGEGGVPPAECDLVSGLSDEIRDLLSAYVWIYFSIEPSEVVTLREHGKLILLDLREFDTLTVTLIDDIGHYLDIGLAAYVDEKYPGLSFREKTLMILAPALPVELLSDVQKANLKFFRTFKERLEEHERERVELWDELNRRRREPLSGLRFTAGDTLLTTSVPAPPAEYSPRILTLPERVRLWAGRETAEADALRSLQQYNGTDEVALHRALDNLGIARFAAR